MVDDMVAVGAFGAIRVAGIDVPGELSVVAFDNLDWTLLVSPALTVISQPVHEMGPRPPER
jgi:LacI family transcriptional regulator